jgi:phytoene dehydrogenase-like protein
MSNMAGQSVVVGAGFGGLSAACYLAQAGARVRVLEKNEQLGGRASRLDAAGFRFDMGPSWYLMPDVFERFFGDFGRRPEDFYSLHRLDPHYRIFFRMAGRHRADREQVKALFEFRCGRGPLPGQTARTTRSACTGSARLRDFATWTCSALLNVAPGFVGLAYPPLLQASQAAADHQYTLVF